MSQVTDALDALAAGQRTIEDVEAFFRQYEWSRRIDPEAEDDNGGALEGSFAEVAAAYSAEQITQDQYTRLAKAAAESMQRHPDAPGPEHSTQEEM